jgi:GTPase KRas protein
MLTVSFLPVLLSLCYLGEYDPTIEDCYTTQTIVNKKTVVLHVLDTAGQDEFKTMRSQWIREGGDGFLVVYSIASRNSFQEAASLRETILRIREEQEKVPIVLIGNKCDLTEEREVSYDEAQAQAEQWACPFFETSALRNINTKACFHELIREMQINKPDTPEKSGICTLL